MRIPPPNDMQDPLLDLLEEIRTNSGPRQTIGLMDIVVTRFAASDQNLVDAISEASINHKEYSAQLGPELLMMDESELIRTLQSDFINFYPAATVNPYVAIAARGPWIITSHGAVLHDNGG